MHFVTLTVPPHRTDHSLMHNSTRCMCPGQSGLQVCFRENVRFGQFSWVIAHDFQQTGQFFCNISVVHILLLEVIWRGSHWFLDHRVHVSDLFSSFRCLWNWELVAQTEVIMMHFVTLTVSPPHTDNSLMHNSTRGMSPSQKGLQVCFRENVCFERFSSVIAHDFQHTGQFFLQHPRCAQTPSTRHLVRFSWIFGL
jgi:hypothetical protein